MRELIDLTLDKYLLVAKEGGVSDRRRLAELFLNLKQVQAAYVNIIHQSLSLIVQNELEKSHSLLARERGALQPVRERIGEFIQQESHNDHPFLKLVLEYLHSRARLVEELKMFPKFSLDLLERLTLDDSLDETIYYLESAMTGKRNLFENLCTAYEVLEREAK